MKATYLSAHLRTHALLRVIAIAGVTLISGTFELALAQSKLAASTPTIELADPVVPDGRETIDMTDCPDGIPAWARPFISDSVYPVVDGYLRWNEKGGAYCDGDPGQVIVNYDPIYGDAVDEQGRREEIDPLHCVLEQERRHYFEDEHGFNGDEVYYYDHELLSNPRTRERFFPVTRSMHYLDILQEEHFTVISVTGNYQNCLRNGRPIMKVKEKVIKIGNFLEGARCIIRFEDTRRMECGDDNIDRSGGEG